MAIFSFQRADAAGPGFSALLSFVARLAVVAAIYFVLAKFGLQLASINPSATPIWPPTGFAMAAALLLGYRVAPAIFAASFIVNVTTAGSIYTAAAIAFGNTLECLIGAYLMNRWSEGRRTFESPIGIAKFCFICLVIAVPVSATIGVGSLSLAGFAGWRDFAGIWATWWLGNLAGALLITPAIVLWANAPLRATSRHQWIESLALFAVTAGIGVLAFSPLVRDSTYRPALGFVAVLPLMWAALRSNPRDTATVALLLSTFAVWGAITGYGPFIGDDVNQSYLLLLAFMLGTAIPSLALSADAAERRDAQTRQSVLLAELTHRVKNTLAVIQSLAARSITDGRSAAEARQIFNDRLTALAHAHDLLIDSSWRGATISSLLATEIHAFSDRISTSGPDVMLKPRAVQTFALLIHELATNSSKHGSLSIAKGGVAVAWSIGDGGDGPRFRFSWTEFDGPRVAPPLHKGFGLTLLERATLHDFDCVPQIQFRSEGFSFDLQVAAGAVIASLLDTAAAEPLVMAPPGVL